MSYGRQEVVVTRIPLSEASAKVRSGPPQDEEWDVDGSVWAGVLSLTSGYGTPVPSPDVDPTTPLLPSVQRLVDGALSVPTHRTPP